MSQLTIAGPDTTERFSGAEKPYTSEEDVVRRNLDLEWAIAGPNDKGTKQNFGSLSPPIRPASFAAEISPKVHGGILYLSRLQAERSTRFALMRKSC